MSKHCIVSKIQEIFSYPNLVSTTNIHDRDPTSGVTRVFWTLACDSADTIDLVQ